MCSHCLWRKPDENMSLEVDASELCVGLEHVSAHMSMPIEGKEQE